MSGETYANRVKAQTDLLMTKIKSTITTTCTPENMDNVKNKVKAQTELLKSEIETKRNIGQTALVNESKTHYQEEMAGSLKILNTYLLYFYYFLFILIHVLFAEQYMRGVKRDEVMDTILFTWFFIFPAVIYYLESYIYFGITYIISFIYGNAYVYNFNKLFMNTDFYAEPSNVSDAIPTMAPVLT
jgi:hypothetical protein